jgi:CubicO group peptidase (beta-lactamase class C family)
MTLRSGLLVALAVAGANTLACSPDRTPATRPRAPDTSALDAYFRKQFPAGEPGGAVLLVKGDRVVFSGAYGLADLRTREPITTRTLFNLGSLSKTFVANAILILQEEGRLSVDDRLSRFFPAFKHPDIAARISIRHLLTHTSGLPDNREVAKNPVFYLTAKDAENWHPVTQADALVFEPGSRAQYSNPAFNGLALIVEKVSGMKWQSFVRDRIFLPSGMKSSTITDGEHPTTGVAHGYERVDTGWREADYGEEPTFAAAGNGGVWSSVEELALYERALRSGTFLSPAAVADSRTIKTFENWVDPEPPVVGWSWFIERTKDNLRTAGHTGSQGGFRTFYVVIPGRSIWFVVLTNSPREMEAMKAWIEQWLRDANWLDDGTEQPSVSSPANRKRPAP